MAPPALPRFVALLSSLLRRMAESNDARRSLEMVQKPPVTVFHSLTRPAISIGSYMERIFTYANCSPCCYVVAFIYLDRLSRNHPLLVLDSFSVHRLLVTSVMVAAKFMDDICYNNAYFAKVGGISTLEMNFMEREFLFGLSFHLNVTPTAYHSYCAYLRREICLDHPAAAAAAALLRSRCHLLVSSDDDQACSNHHRHRQKS